MGERAEALAARFEEANRTFMEAVRGIPEDRWGSVVPGEGWPVGVVAHHVASMYEINAAWVLAQANGQALEPAPQTIDEINAEHARQHAGCTREEVLELARRNGEAAARLLRGLSDEQLERRRTWRTYDLSTADVIERVMIGHPAVHLRTIRSATG
ncbi:MAG TPA: DinB family protein [Dehalococcoidia bacterium]